MAPPLYPSDVVNWMDDLTVEQIIAFHVKAMKTDGSDERLLSEAGLHQMVFSTNRIDDIYQKVAHAIFSLVAYPAFREGNIHTALLVAEKLLNDNGYTLKDSNDGLNTLILGIEAFTVEPPDIEEWLHAHIKRNV